MKTTILIFMMSFFSLSIYAAEGTVKKTISPWPLVTVFPSGVEVSVSNFTLFDYECNGTIFIQYESGKNATHLYFSRVYSGATVDQVFYSDDPADDIINAHESIFCYKYSK